MTRRRPIATPMLRTAVPRPIMVIVAQVPRLARHNRLPAPRARRRPRLDAFRHDPAQLLMLVAVAPGVCIAHAAPNLSPFDGSVAADIHVRERAARIAIP